MCGIVGFMGSTETLHRMNTTAAISALGHRGPDATGTWCSQIPSAPGKSIWFGHTRLSIIDLSDRGRQPMQDPASGSWIIYNGEVYNFHEVRSELRHEEYQSATDTEVLLAAYAERGSASLDLMAGMYAFAIWDAPRQQLFLARDRLGIKPLYYYQGHDFFAFSSEIRALLATGLIPRRADPVAIESYLGYGAVQAPQSIIEGVKSLSSAHHATIDPATLSIAMTRYWRPPFARRGESYRYDPEELSDLLRHIVNQHLISDVPLGAFLSGGIDSGALTAMVTQGGRRLSTFSVSFAEEAYSEARYARMVAERCETDHTEVNLLDSDVLGFLPNALAAIDQPSIDGINVYSISRAVREAGVTVVLSGQGGDEVFAGYPTFQRAAAYAPFLRAAQYTPRVARDVLGKMVELAFSERLVRHKLSELLETSADTLSLYLVLRQLFDTVTRRKLFQSERVASNCISGLRADVYANLRYGIQDMDPVNQISSLELDTYLANMLLRDGDSMSMASSLEVRVPYLDHRLVDYVAAIPGHEKLSPKMPKPLLLRTAGNLIPEAIYKRPKSGFTFPWEYWLRNRIRTTVDEVLNDPKAGASIGLQPDAIHRLWRGFLNRDPGVTWSRVWALFVLIDWCARHEVRQ